MLRFRRSFQAALGLSATAAGVYAYDETHEYSHVVLILSLVLSLLYFLFASSHSISRCARVFIAGGRVMYDIKKNLRPLERGTPEYREELHRLSFRIAQRLYTLCKANGGIYTKFGQQLATMNHGLPKEVTDVMAQLQDKAQEVSFEVASRTLEEDLGGPWDVFFREFETKPLAAASLAQVHRAVDFQGRQVAVKIQYPHLASQVGGDLKVMHLAARVSEYFYPDLKVVWLMPEFEKALMQEFDFRTEKRNSRRIQSLLQHLSYVYVPQVYDELSSKRILTMEYIDAPKISDIEAMKQLGLSPPDVATRLCQVFSDMIFCSGFVHCDPHPGNIFVRKNPDPKAACKEQLVLLDHGLYRELDEDFRRAYCDLWRALLLRDTNLLEECGQRLGIGAFTKYLPLILTYRGADSNAPLGTSMNEEERTKMQEELSQVQRGDVSEFLKMLPRDMLFIFKTNNMIRAINKELGGTTRERFAIMGKYAVEGHARYYEPTGDEVDTSVWGSVMYYKDHVNMLLHLYIVDWVLGTLQFTRGEKPRKMKSHG